MNKKRSGKHDNLGKKLLFKSRGSWVRIPAKPFFFFFVTFAQRQVFFTYNNIGKASDRDTAQFLFRF